MFNASNCDFLTRSNPNRIKEGPSPLALAPNHPSDARSFAALKRNRGSESHSYDAFNANVTSEPSSEGVWSWDLAIA